MLIDFSKKMRLEICYMDQCLNFLYDPFWPCKHHFEILHVLKMPHQTYSKMPLDNSFTNTVGTVNVIPKVASIYIAIHRGSDNVIDPFKTIKGL